MVKKILYLRSGPYKPDIQKYNMQEIGFAKECIKNNISCDIIYYSDENKEEIFLQNGSSQIKIIWKKGFKILRTGLYLSLLNKKKLKAYDLIIVTEYSQIMSYLISRIHKNVVLYNGPYYNLFKIKFTEKIYDFLFNKSINNNLRHVFSKSILSTRYLKEKGYDKISTIGVALDISRFSEVNSVLSETHEVLEYMKDSFNYLFVGNINDNKNFPFLISVFNAMISLKKNLKQQLIIVGKGEEKYINSIMNKYSSIKDKVLIVDSLRNDQLKYIYEKSNIFLFPSKLEIFGMVMLEAMYFGLPVITSLHGGSSTVINEFNGIIIDEFDNDKWCTAILELLSDEVKMNSISVNARETIINDYTWEKLYHKIILYLDKDVKAQ